MKFKDVKDQIIQPKCKFPLNKGIKFVEQLIQKLQTKFYLDIKKGQNKSQPTKEKEKEKEKEKPKERGESSRAGI